MERLKHETFDGADGQRHSSLDLKADAIGLNLRMCASQYVGTGERYREVTPPPLETVSAGPDTAPATGDGGDADERVAALIDHPDLISGQEPGPLAGAEAVGQFGGGNTGDADDAVIPAASRAWPDDLLEGAGRRVRYGTHVAVSCGVEIAAGRARRASR